MGTGQTAQPSTRERVIQCTLRLLERNGIGATSTRAIAMAAGVQAPTIYREFGDKQGLLHAVVERGFHDYLNERAVTDHTDDPLADLRRAWDLHIDFAVAHPTLYMLMASQPDPTRPSPAGEAGWRILATLVHRVAQGGLLRVDETEAVRLVQAAGSGTALMMISIPDRQRHRSLSDRSRNAIIAAIAHDPGGSNESGPHTAAITLSACLAGLDMLTESERHLLGEWLDRIIHSADRAGNDPRDAVD